MSPSRPQPEQHAPPVQWLRIRYAKRGRARFTSHRDFSRAFERALRRAGVPMAYSSGFSPHPRISYANACPTGSASEAEYLDIGLSEACAPQLVQAALDAALPPGLDVVAVGPPHGGLAEVLTASAWRVDLDGVDPTALSAAVHGFWSLDSVVVERMTGSGLRSFDARGALLTLGARSDGLELALVHLVPLVRPDDVLAGIERQQPGLLESVVPVLHRTAQGRWDEVAGLVRDPPLLLPD